MNRVLQFLKVTMIGGLIFLVPLVVLVAAIGKALAWTRHLAEPMAAFIPIDTIAGLAIVDLVGLILLVVACFLAGLAARTRLVQHFVSRVEERVLSKIPGYRFVKAISDNVQHKEQSDFAMRPVLVRLDDSSQLGFEIERLADGRVVVYMPGSPQPQAGIVLIVEAGRVQVLPATVATAIRSLAAFGSGTRSFVGISDPDKQPGPSAH